MLTDPTTAAAIIPAKPLPAQDGSSKAVAAKARSIGPGESGQQVDTGAAELKFSDFLDMINPLQHIPIVNTIYRNLTGDTPSPVGNVVGGLLYGGPIGLVASAIGEQMRESTGRDPAEQLYAMVTGGDQAPTPAAKSPTQLAQATDTANPPPAPLVLASLNSPPPSPLPAHPIDQPVSKPSPELAHEMPKKMIDGLEKYQALLRARAAEAAVEGANPASQPTPIITAG
jgi:hypothetical protein